MSISEAISKAQTSDGNSSKQPDDLERQVDALDFYGMVKSGPPPTKKRGRPPGSKSKSPGRVPQAPDEFPTTSKQKKSKVDDILDKMNRNRLLTKLRAYHAYWPDICPLTSADLSNLTVEEMEKLIEMFELSVNSFSEIVDVPQTIKTAISNIEPVAINVGLTNPEHKWLSKGKYMSGFSSIIQTDPNIDRNVKLLSIRFLGRVPRSPIISLLYHITGAALQTITANQSREAAADRISRDYDNL
jgi:hypothetical protein